MTVEAVPSERPLSGGAAASAKSAASALGLVPGIAATQDDAMTASARGVPANLIWQPRFLGLVAIADIAAIAVLGLLAHLLLNGRPGTAGFGVFIVGGVLGVAIMQRLWSYTVQGLGSFVRQAGVVAAAMSINFGAMMAIAYLLNWTSIIERRWLVVWFCATILALLGLRWLISKLVHRWALEGRLVRRAVIVGGGRGAEELVQAIERTSEQGIQILGIFDDRHGDRSPEQQGRYLKLGTFESLVGFCRTARIDLLIVTLPLTAEDRLHALLKRLWVLPVDIRLSAHTSKLRLMPRSYSYIGGMPFLALFDKPLSDWSSFVKAAEDRLLGALLLVLLSPVMAAVALAVKFDSRGPVFFRQNRYGFNNELIGVYKFRSMYTDMTDATASKLVTKDDPRVTRVGRFIRKTSLDELPQLINVVRGELSLVGPRPHAQQAKADNQLYHDVVEGYFARHKLKPGITGWAQVNGWRGETDTVEKIEQRVAYDLQYIDNWSVWFDLYILALTPFALVKSQNAY